MKTLDPKAYYHELAAAYARGRTGAASTASDEEALAAALAAGVRLYRFKRNAELPRVRRVLGVLSGLQLSSVLDIGSGRGTFLWPLLDAFPSVEVLAIDRDPRRAEQLGTVRRGGLTRLRAARMDATCLGLASNGFEVVTALEVLEHLEEPERAIAEALRVARRFVVASVPSREDDNPEHLQLFDEGRLSHLFRQAGAARVKVEFVRSHLICLARAR